MIGVQLNWLPAIVAVIWVAALLVVLLRSTGGVSTTAPTALTPTDLLLAASIALAATALRLWPLLGADWINAKPDEGVYFGAAWLLRDGILPYRDYVFAHLPGSLLLLQPAASMVSLWQNNAQALLAARAIAACSDGITAGLVYLIARHLVQRPGALLAGFVYAADALAVEYSRAVMLEPLQAPWLALGALGVCATLRGRRFGFAAGVCLAIGVSVKISGVVVVAAAVLALLLEARRRDLLALLAGVALGTAALYGWLFVAAGDELLRQTLLLQLLRPRDAGGQLRFLLGDRRMLFTAATMLLGTLALAAQAWRRPVGAAWRFVVLWCALELLLLVIGASFFEHYTIGLLPTLALLAAALPPWLAGRRYRRAAVPAALLLLLAPLAWWQAGLWTQLDRRTTGREEVALLQTLPAGKPVLSWIALYNIVAGRPIAQAPGGPYLLDTFLGDRYLDSELNRRWPTAEQTYARAAAAAEYILGARYQTSALPGIRSQFIWQPVTERNDTVLFTRVDQPATHIAVGSELELLGLTPGRVESIAGQRWLVQPLHWRAAQTPPPDQALALHLVDSAGTRVAQLDVPVNGGIAWEPEIITTLEYRLPVPASVPAGTYGVRVAVYSWQDGAVLPLVSQVDGPLDSTLELSPVALP